MAKFISSQLDLLSLPALRPVISKLSIDDYVVLFLLFAGAVAYITHGKLWAKPDPYLYKLYERPQEHFSTIKRDETSRDIARQLEQLNKDAVIFWGSQSGTAEGFACRLARDCARRFGLNVLVADLSDYDPETISHIAHNKFVLFLVSTYGEGDPSDNTTEFLAWLQKRSEILSNIHYAAFGLGNSNYVYYNKVIDDIVRCLEALSAVALLPVGKADDANGGTEEDFASWRDELFTMFQQKLGLEEQVPQYTPSIIVSDVTDSVESKPQTREPLPLKLSRKAARDYSAINRLSLKETRTLTTSSSTGRCCLHFEIDLRAYPQMKYKTGDHLAIWPTNSAEEFERLVRVLGLESKVCDEIVVFAADAETEVKIPKHSTISALFQHYLEISGPVSRDTVSTLAQLAATQSVKSFLEHLCTKSTWATFTAQNHVTLARLLEHTLLHDPTASWSNLPLAFVIESLRPMTPRYYSISSSSMTSPRQLAITVAVSPAELPLNPAVSIPGLTTSYLAGLDIQAAPFVYGHIRRSTFKMPFLHRTPIVLVAAGTGLAPFRGFLQERAQMAQISNQEIGETVLVFGCRNPDQDYLYKAELEALQSGPLKGKLEIITAFSRVPEQKKVYVQDRLAEPEIKKNIMKILCEKEGNLYFCGSTTMAKTAGRTLINAVREHRNLGEAEGKMWMDDMKRGRRWQEDVWG